MRDGSTYFEEVFGGTSFQSAVLDLALLGEVVGVLDGREHSFDGEERGQVGGVGRDDDKRKEPPRTADYPTRQRPASQPVRHTVNHTASVTPPCKHRPATLDTAAAAAAAVSRAWNRLAQQWRSQDLISCRAQHVNIPSFLLPSPSLSPFLPFPSPPFH